MLKSTRIFLFFFLFFISLSIFLSPAFSSELWTKYNGSIRHYLILENDDGIKLKHYSQEKGDYQDRISTQTFKTYSQARDHVRLHYPDYRSSKTLLSWPVDQSVSDKANRNIWVANNRWSAEWERNYAAWLQETITADFYIKYGIATDCSDALIGYRWIYARMNSLPVANTVSDTGSLFGHFSMRKGWGNLPTSYNWYDDQLFLTALSYVMDMTSTTTVMASDGFPVAITKLGLQAGTFIVSRTNGSGHMRTITENLYESPSDLPLYTHSSTAPREVRALYREAFIDQAWPIRGTREVMAFRWPIPSGSSWVLNAKRNDNRYSEEQFNIPLQKNYVSFIQFVIGRVKPSYDPYRLVSTGVEDIVNLTNVRIKIVRDGFEYCSSHDCRNGTQAYEDWSTPNRDYKYLLKYNEIEDLVIAFDSMYPGLKDQWYESLNTTTIEVEGHTLSLARLRYLFEKKMTSYNPSDPILRRWGLE